MRVAMVALLAAGCGYVRADLAKRPWVEVSTAHFRLVTDLPAAAASARAEKLEGYWWILVRSFAFVAPSQKRLPRVVHVYDFASCTDLRDVTWNSSIAGYMTSSLDFARDPMFVTCDSNPPAILMHELTHTFVAHFIGEVPVWLNEGLAQYLETPVIADGKVVLGTPPQGIVTQVAILTPGMVKPPPLAALVAADYEKFHSNDRIYYLGAWVLVHLLNNSSPDYHRRFQAYLMRLAAGEAPDSAWKDALGDVADRLREELAYYLPRETLATWIVPISAPPPATPEVRSLRPAEIHAMWVHLQMHRLLVTGGDVSPVFGQLALAEKDDPGWPELLLWRAAFAYYFDKKVGSRIDGVEVMRRYLVARPTDGRGWLGLVRLEMQKIEPEEYLGVDDRPIAAAPEIERDVRELVKYARSARELEAIGWYFALRRMPAVGMNFGERSVAEDPTCRGCWDTLALLEFEAGRCREAAASETRAVKLYHDAPKIFTRRLEAYRRCAKP